MKRRNLIPALLAALLLFSTCDNLFSPIKAPAPKSYKGKALVYITILNDQARTVMPSIEENNITSYRLFGSTSGMEDELISFSNKTGASVNLDFGTWNFTLEAYDDQDKLILQGKVQGKVINQNGSNTVAFVLMPPNSGMGAVSITLNFPAGADITNVTVNCDELGLEDEDISISGSSAVYF